MEVSPSEPEPESELASGGCTLGTCKTNLEKFSDFILIKKKYKRKGGQKTTKLIHKNIVGKAKFSSSFCSSERVFTVFSKLQPQKIVIF